MSLGQGTSFAGEAGKGGPAAARIYHLLDSKQGVYDTTEDLETPVSNEYVSGYTHTHTHTHTYAAQSPVALIG